MDSVRGIDSFVRAVEAGSIAGGARRLGISPAAASQNIARLEARLGVRLLTRTTRSLALTDSGRLYYQRVGALLDELNAASEAVSELHDEPRGRLCIAATAAFARHVLAPLIPAFNHLYPHITIELKATDRSVDHVRESVDVSIRIRPALEDGLVARHIARVPSVFCAAPEYLARRGTPVTPEQLQEHDCLVFRFPLDGRFLRWGFVRDGELFYPPVHAAIISDDIDTLARMAVAGAGITRLGAFIAAPYIERGELIELFTPIAEVEPLDFYFCVRDRHQLTGKVRVFRDYLLQAVPDCWRAP
ncbi:LysR family transcriptional regulator [Gilvimarinus agarilyticus]|uniref:LysR family transcriptional regulator n=1 Tax=Gilvimarinus agarilyticus TaxID=679259 RepID=UPI00059F7137|nr:LysR family transcriptional regulator [Gilvimarinus agarilyticus]